MALPPRLCLAALDCASASVRASAISCYSRRVGRSLSPARPRMKLRLSTAATPTATPGPDSGPVAVRMPPAPSSLWLADLRARVGKCIGFGCSTAQVAQASAVLRALATEWRGLMAGNEGFLTGGRRGLSDQKVVWGEMDSFGHVNNVTYYRYAESARVNWITNFAVHEDPANRDRWTELMTPRSTGLIMKSLKADFKFPMVYPDTISVYHKLRHPPDTGSERGGETPAPSSLVLDCIVISHQHRRVAARLEEDIVVYDYQAARKTAMPPFVRDMLAKTWTAQLRETARARERTWELVRAVERLERGTWDRKGAMEAWGSAAAA